jgi:poly(A) polymerase
MSLHHSATAVVSRLQEHGHAAYFAGGSVRDRLLGRPCKDIDIATAATPEEVMRLFPRHAGLEGKCFGVVRVLVDDDTLEVATFRADGDYTDGRRPDSVRFTTAEEDAQRRDFTVNGMFFDPLTETVIDYVGGQEDLKRKVLRAIGKPAERFQEDKLRLLRAVRFATVLGFEIEPETWSALQAMAPDIAQIAVERIRDELDKIWTSAEPARGLDLLDTSGLLKMILPEVHRLHGVEQPPQFHPEGDVFKHTRLMLSHLHHAPLELALGVLLHDIGKQPTYFVDETGRIRFNEHETVGARMTERLMQRLRYSNDLIETVTTLVALHMQFKDAPKMRVSTLKRMMARPTFSAELELHRIDCLGCHGDLSIHDFLREKYAAFGAEEVKPKPLINGHDVMKLGVPGGKRVGELLEQIYDAQLENRITTREEALVLAQQLSKHPAT